MPTYNFSFVAADCSGRFTVGCLGESGDSILRMPATSFHEIHEDLEQVKALGLSLHFSQISMTVRAKIDLMGNSQEEG